MEDPKKCEFFTKQFQARRFLFSFEEPDVIGTAQCGQLQILYLLYRIAWAIWWLAILIYSLATDPAATWLTYLTNWTLTLVFVSAVLQLCAAIYAFAKSQKTDNADKKTPILYKINWIVYNGASNVALIVTLMYWAALYSGDVVSFENACTHAMNSVYVLIDIWITGVPIRILHFYVSSLYGVIYGIFSIIYWAAGGGAIYSILDWSQSPGLAAGLILGISLVLVPLIQLVLFCMYWLRVLLYAYVCTCCLGKGSKVDPNEDVETGKLEGKDNPAFTNNEKY